MAVATLFATLLTALLAPLWDGPAVENAPYYVHGAITHRSSSTELDYLITVAIREWGYEDGGYGDEIVGLPEFPNAADTYATAEPGISCAIRMAQLNVVLGIPNPDSGPFLVEIDQQFWQSVITHEVGHCLGLGHMRGNSIMNGSRVFHPTDGDRSVLALVQQTSLLREATVDGDVALQAAGDVVHSKDSRNR